MEASGRRYGPVLLRADFHHQRVFRFRGVNGEGNRPAYAPDELRARGFPACTVYRQIVLMSILPSLQTGAENRPSQCEREIKTETPTWHERAQTFKTPSQNKICALRSSRRQPQALSGVASTTCLLLRRDGHAILTSCSAIRIQLFDGRRFRRAESAVEACVSATSRTVPKLPEQQRYAIAIHARRGFTRSS